MGTIEVAADSPFGLDNLPYGVFSPAGGAPRVGVRLGDTVVDLATLLPTDAEVFAVPALNPFMAQGPARWREIRRRVTDLLAGGVPAAACHRIDAVAGHLPFEVADYVDFYASEHHASNVGRLFRPGAPPLPAAWKHLPIAYHGRAGTVVVSGTGIVRPRGQRAHPDEDMPVFGPSLRLDIEAELGFVVGVGSPLGSPITVDEFDDHVFGAVLVNDWSARDLQSWEHVPLGPHQGKSFATSISPWVVPMAALRAARVPLPRQIPEPLPYLRPGAPGGELWGLDVDVAVEWNGEMVSRPPYREMYWSPAQMLAHLTVNGASTRTGDLFASGTVSGPRADQRGAFLELTWGGAEPVRVGGERRAFLLDGDRVTITGTAPGSGGGRVGFGAVTGTVLPAPS
ncbi:fumarylacetoacetase [Frankia sp. CNm7]|uniref:fumarylacetoacetase n=1 Tax=Frankia nepalensis TaxID=1836974 RepID=A0A937RCW8_9ACTN|nr:fumarylacetoacetase [Frankia nepalensis]MBL7496579.1 fumarylacetoacetase [Frankia nepalensis]MBL7508798.1 fumarylacetoacetase [Frankia nepalensis]MBL7518945.1 fumarylacetoacetase [Frankia nepalensis]MBL7627552.1 fumarylacetoacetase [Frankia nepalensis]